MIFNLRIAKRNYLVAATFFLFLQTIPADSTVAQTPDEQVTCEVTILKVAPRLAKKILDAAGENAIIENGIENVTTNVHSVKKNSAKSSPKSLHKAAVRSFQMDVGDYEHILDELENSKECSVSPGLKTVTSASGKAFGFAGKARPYCTSYESRRAQFGSRVDVPVYRVIENGLIAKHNATVEADGTTALESQIVINDIVEVQTYTMSGANGPVTLQLPTTKTRQLDVQANLGEGQVLVVSSDYMEAGFEQPKTKTTYKLGRLFKNVGISRGEPCKLFYVISAKPTASQNLGRKAADAE